MMPVETVQRLTSRPQDYTAYKSSLNDYMQNPCINLNIGGKILLHNIQGYCKLFKVTAFTTRKPTETFITRIQKLN